MKAIILAAGMGTRLQSVSGGVPKCMVEVGGIPLIDRMIKRIADAGISELIVVTGFEADKLRSHVSQIDHPLAQSAVFVHNDRYSDMGNFYSLLVAEEAVADSAFVKFDGDVLMDEKVLPIVLAAKGPLTLAVDCREGLGEEEMKVQVDDSGAAIKLNKNMAPKDAVGEYIGIDSVEAQVTKTVFNRLRSMIELGETGGYYERAYELLMEDGVRYELADITGCQWTEIDDAEDLKVANTMVTA